MLQNAITGCYGNYLNAKYISKFNGIMVYCLKNDLLTEEIKYFSAVLTSTNLSKAQKRHSIFKIYVNLKIVIFVKIYNRLHL